jgi:hypothetical protein
LNIIELLKSPLNFKKEVKKMVNLPTDLTVIGGHSIISAVHLEILCKSGNDKYAYFWEHHAGKFESIE